MSTKNNGIDLITKAIIDYEDYKKLNNYYEMGKVKNKDADRHSPKSTEDKIVDTDNDGKNYVANQINKEFNIESNGNSNQMKNDEEKNTTKVVPMENVIEEKEEEEEHENEPSSLSNLLDKITDSNYVNKAKKLFEIIKLDIHHGGVFTLDNEQYLPEELGYIITRLYISRGKNSHHGSANDKSKFELFVNSLNERKLKKYVKNKTAFANLNKSWWRLN